MTERYQQTQRVTWIGILVNAGQAALKMVVGTVGSSPALIADGVHSLGDLVCNFMVLFASRLANLDADDNHPYGHWRIETFATLMLGVFLLVVGVGIAYEGIISMVHGTLPKPDLFTVWAAVASIGANEILFRYTLKTADRINSDMLRANAWHSRGDSLASLIVLVGLIGALAGWLFLDAVAAVAVAIFIGKMGVEWGWQAIKELTDAGLDEAELTEISAAILALPGVVHMHQLRTRKMAGKVFLDVHILIKPYTSASEGHYIAEAVRMALIKLFINIEDVTVHVDVEEHPEQLPERLPANRETLLARLMPKWFTIVPQADILHVTLHYLRGKIHMEVQLAMTLLTIQKLNPQLLQAAFVDTIKAEPEIKSIKLFFVAS